MRSKLLFFLLCVTLPGIYAQDWKADLGKAYEIFNQNALEIEVEHLFYPSLFTTVPTERQTVWMRKMGNNYHVKQYGMEMISNDRYVVMIDEKAKIIGINSNEKNLKTSGKEADRNWDIVLQAIANLSSSLGIDTLQAKEFYTCTYLGQNDGTKSYRFDYRKGEFQQSTVYLSSRTGLLERISCVYREPQEVEPGVFRQVRIDMVYKKLLAGKKFNNDQFSTDGIFSVNAKGGVTLNGKYSQYYLINNMK
jgi:hypothetical protein